MTLITFHSMTRLFTCSSASHSSTPYAGTRDMHDRIFTVFHRLSLSSYFTRDVGSRRTNSTGNNKQEPFFLFSH